jgi:hypothetical protein
VGAVEDLMVSFFCGEGSLEFLLRCLEGVRGDIGGGIMADEEVWVKRKDGV